MTTTDIIDDATVNMIMGWLILDRGDAERLARWMARNLKLAGIRECRRWIGQARVIDAYRQIGADARLEIDGLDTMTPDQLNDELVYLADYQG